MLLAAKIKIMTLCLLMAQQSEKVQTANAKDGAAQLRLGEKLEEDGRAGEAFEALTAAVRLLPKSAEAHNARGEALADLNSLKPARSEFEKALQLNPAMPMAHLNLGMVLAQTDELALAARHLDFAMTKLHRSEDLARAHYLRAKVYTDLSQVERAKTELQIAVKLEPEFGAAWSDLGQALKTLQDDKGALAAFERAVELSPSDPVALMRLGVELYREGQLKTAIEQLQKADQVNPKDQTTLNTLQSALRADGQTAAANEVKQRLVEVLHERDVNTQNQLAAARLNQEGQTLAQGGDLTGAVEKYRKGVELDPENVAIRVNFAGALLKLGDSKEGLTQLAEAMRQQPGDAVLETKWEEARRTAPAGALPPF